MSEIIDPFGQPNKPSVELRDLSREQAVERGRRLGEQEADFTYFPIISKWIRNQKKLFRQRGHNFGIVHVDFDGPTPRVTFTLHYNDGGWKTRPAIITSNSSNS